MNKASIVNFVKSTQQAVAKHSPEILTGIGIAGLVTTTILAVRATPKALGLIELEREGQNQKLLAEAEVEGYENCAQITQLKPLDIVKVTWKCYLPAAALGITSIVCLIGASSVNARRNAALATAYKISETAFTEYRDKVVETIGEKKEDVIREKIDKDHLDRNPVTRNEVIITGKGGTLCFDYYSGRYFESDIDNFKKAINQLNAMMLREEYVSLNDLYDEMGLEHTGVGDILGWNANRVGRDLIQPRISSHITDDDRSAIVMSCDPAPTHDYSRF